MAHQQLETWKPGPCCVVNLGVFSHGLWVLKRVFPPMSSEDIFNHVTHHMTFGYVWRVFLLPFEEIRFIRTPTDPWSHHGPDFWRCCFPSCCPIVVLVSP